MPTQIIPTYESLQKALTLDSALPVTQDWSAAADFLEIIKDHCLKFKPQIIVECSSGTTTLVLARCCQLNNLGRVFSLENGEEYATNTQNNLKSFALENYANVIHSPLKDIELNGASYQWYALSELPQQQIEMLVIDGPPGFIQRHSRYPALPLLFNQLADNAVVFLDDAARDEEKAIVKRWQAEYPATEHEYIDTERGCSILVVHKK